MAEKSTIDQILEHNAHFVEEREYEQFKTDKYPDKKLAVVSCMDTRLTALLMAALGLKNGDAKIIKVAGAEVSHPFGSVMRSLLIAVCELGVEDIMIVAHTNCGAQHMSGEGMISDMLRLGVSADHIHELCERDHCGCDEGEDEDEREHGHGHDHGHEGEHEHHHDHGHSHSHEGAPVLSIIRSAISHTVQVSVFIFLVTLILVAVLETFGESAIEQFLRGNETLAVLGSALVGLIPNCSASVVITQLYLEGALQLAPMLAGTLISAGVGYLVLFRTNRSARENAVFLVMMYVIGAGWGLILSAFGL